MNNFLKIIKTKLLTHTVIYKLWLFIALGIIILKGVLIGWNTTSGDFNNYYVSAKLVAQGSSIHQFYDNDWFDQKAQELGIKEGAKFSPFPPSTAYIFLPITPFELLTAKRIWLVFNILMLIGLPFRIRKILKWPLNQTILVLSLFIIPISICLRLGQLYLLIGFLLIELLGQIIVTNKPKLLGFTIGLLTALKYLPILFLGYIFNHKKRYTILICTLLGIGIPSLIVFALDNQAYDAFFQHFLAHLQGDLAGQSKYAIPFQSIDSLLNNLFVYDPLKNPFPFLNLAILKPIIKFLLLGLIFGLLLRAFKKNQYQVTPVIVSIGIIGSFVLIPASASYHFLLLLWPVLCLMKWLIAFKSKQALVIISILIFMTFTISHNHIPNFNQFPVINLLLHYPRFWGLLCLFLLLIYYHITSLKKSYG